MTMVDIASPVCMPSAEAVATMSHQVNQNTTSSGGLPGFRTIGQLLLQRAAQHDQHTPAFVDVQDPERNVITFGQLVSKTVTLAAGLRQIIQGANEPALALRDGDAVAVFCPNVVIYPVVVLALNIAGLKVAPAHYGYTEYEVEEHLRLVNAKAIFTVPALAPIAEKALQLAAIQLPIVIMPSSSEDEAVHGKFIALQKIMDAAPPKLPAVNDFASNVSPHDVAYLCLSSGTTGPSKAVQVSNFNMISSIQQYASFRGMRQAAATTAPQQRTCCVTPMVRMAGLVGMHMCLVGGGTMYLFSPFSVESWVRDVKRFQITTSMLMPAMLVDLLHSPDIDPADLSSLHHIFTGGAPLDAVTQRECMLKLKVSVIQGYGMTEGAGGIAGLPEDHFFDPNDLSTFASCGTPLPGIDLRIVDPETLKPVPKGERGEIVIRGPNITQIGYLNAPEANARTFVDLPDEKQHEPAIGTGAGAPQCELGSLPRRWMRTGDIGLIDERGHLRIVDRIKELIKYRGVHVPPAEIEAVLLQHPRVVDAAVLGRPDEVDGELPMAFVVLGNKKQQHGSVGDANGGAEPTAEEGALCQDIKLFVEQRVASFKHLRGGIQVIDEIPRNSTGKILRRELRTQILM